MMALNVDQAAKDMGGAVDYLLASDAVTLPGSVSSASAWAAAWPSCWPRHGPTRSRACAPFYGVIPWPDARARLVEALRPRCSATSPRTTIFTPAMVGEPRGPAARRWARTPSSSSTRAPTTPSSTTPGPRSTTPAGRPRPGPRTCRSSGQHQPEPGMAEAARAPRCRPLPRARAPARPPRRRVRRRLLRARRRWPPRRRRAGRAPAASRGRA